MSPVAGSMTSELPAEPDRHPEERRESVQSVLSSRVTVISFDGDVR
jgi:hypothetical protein